MFWQPDDAVAIFVENREEPIVTLGGHGDDPRSPRFGFVNVVRDPGRSKPRNQRRIDFLRSTGIRDEFLAVRSVELNVAVQYVFQFSRGDAMDWTTMLAYITGSVDQELLQRNE